MRVTLLYNPDSGYGHYSKERLLELLRASGYEPSYREMDDDFEEALHDPGELVVVAGGDGTLGKAAQAMASRADSGRVPLAVLPLGTANNTARALGWTGPPEAIISAWAEAQPQAFDVGLAEGPWGRAPFLEAAGLGLFPEVMTHLSHHKKQREGRLTSASEELALDLSTMLDVLETQHARPFQLSLDGEDLSGEYLLVEAMNLEAIGPHLRFNAESNSSDGLFELVLLTEAERPLLTEYFGACINANRSPNGEWPPLLELNIHRGKHLRIDWQGQLLHADSQVWKGRLAQDRPAGTDELPQSKDSEGKATPADAPATVELHLHTGALRFLTLPDGASSR